MQSVHYVNYEHFAQLWKLINKIFLKIKEIEKKKIVKFLYFDGQGSQAFDTELLTKYWGHILIQFPLCEN